MAGLSSFQASYRSMKSAKAIDHRDYSDFAKRFFFHPRGPGNFSIQWNSGTLFVKLEPCASDPCETVLGEDNGKFDRDSPVGICGGEHFRAGKKKLASCSTWLIRYSEQLWGIFFKEFNWQRGEKEKFVWANIWFCTESKRILRFINLEKILRT